MKRALRLILPLAVLLGSVWAGAALLAPDRSRGRPPHDFVKEQAKCDTCHEVEWKGQVGTMETDKFSASFVEVCAQRCHVANLTRSHPVNVNPYKKIKRDRYPENLPLQFSETLNADVMTCVTCHKPHAERHSPDKLHARQKEDPESGQFLTYYLRIRGQNAREGYAPLCKTCHPQL